MTTESQRYNCSPEMKEMPSPNMPVQRLKVTILPLGLSLLWVRNPFRETLTTGNSHGKNQDRFSLNEDTKMKKGSCILKITNIISLFGLHTTVLFFLWNSQRNVLGEIPIMHEHVLMIRYEKWDQEMHLQIHSMISLPYDRSKASIQSELSARSDLELPPSNDSILSFH